MEPLRGLFPEFRRLPFMIVLKWRQGFIMRTAYTASLPQLPAKQARDSQTWRDFGRRCVSQVHPGRPFGSIRTETDLNIPVAYNASLGISRNLQPKSKAAARPRAGPSRANEKAKDNQKDVCSPEPGRGEDLMHAPMQCMPINGFRPDS